MKKKIIWGTLILLTLAFIFSRSMKSVSDSSQESLLITHIITPVLEVFLGKGNVTDHIVRKLAHFCEFGLLGFEMAAFFQKRSLWPFFCSLLCALGDETIQIFFDRGSQVADVWLDFSGAFCGIWFWIFLAYLLSKKNMSKNI